MAGSHETVTEILQAVGAGDPQAAEQLLPLVYDELRRLATAKAALVYKVWLQANRKSTTLVEQPTAAKT